MQKVALLTGGTSKIGKHIALLLRELDFNVIVQYYSKTGAIEAQRLIEKGVIKFAIQADFASDSFMLKILDAVYDVYHQIDLLINNAAIFEFDTSLDFSPYSLERHIKINAIAPISLIREVLSRQQNLCKIINMLDINTNKLTKRYFSYNVSKKMLQNASSLILHAKPDVQIRNLYLDKIDTYDKLQSIIQELRLEVM
jgi:short-subunit dehydrogenase